MVGSPDQQVRRSLQHCNESHVTQKPAAPAVVAGQQQFGWCCCALSLNKVKENASSSKNTLSSGIESKTKISPLKEGDEVSNAIVEQDNSLLIKEELKKQEQPNSSNSNNESEIVPPEIKESVIADSNPEKNIESINSNINTTQNEEIELSETNAVKDNNKNEDAVIIDTLDTNLSENSTIHSDTSESASVQIDSLSTDKEDKVALEPLVISFFQLGIIVH